MAIKTTEDTKMKNIILTLTGWLVMAAALIITTTACSNEDYFADEPTPATTKASKTYTMTVSAAMPADDATRALSVDGKKLNATWAAGDAVKVYKTVSGANVTDPETYVEVGTLKATNISADGLSATLTGTVALDSKVRLSFFYVGQYNDGTATGSVASTTYDYSSQTGTLDDVATRFDRAMTALSASKYEIDGNRITTNNTLSFTNQQAIVTFKLKNASGSTVSVSNLKVEATGGYSFSMSGNGTNGVPATASTITVTPASAANTFTIAIPPISSGTATFPIRLTADGTDGYTYYYEKDNVTAFAKGQYYEISVKMKRFKDLSKLTADYTAQDGDELRGTIAKLKHLSIASGASVTLNGVIIADHLYSGIICEGDATITLVGENSVATKNTDRCGIQAGGSETTLTIGGDGSLTATGMGNGAGIGSCYYGIDCGAIYITGGNINATGGYYSAGIGACYTKNCGDITISGGNVTALGGNNSAGIGASGAHNCGTITISGGSVIATGGNEGAGIGTGHNDTCGAITISGGSVTATGSGISAGIGTGNMGTCGAITISGGTVIATAGDKLSAGIGSAEEGKFSSITITDGISRVTATGFEPFYGYQPIGKGNGDTVSGTVTVDGVANWTGGETEHLSFSAGGVIIGGDNYMRWVLQHK